MIKNLSLSRHCARLSQIFDVTSKKTLKICFSNCNWSYQTRCGQIKPVSRNCTTNKIHVIWVISHSYILHIWVLIYRTQPVASSDSFLSMKWHKVCTVFQQFWRLLINRNNHIIHCHFFPVWACDKGLLCACVCDNSAKDGFTTAVDKLWLVLNFWHPACHRTLTSDDSVASKVFPFSAYSFFKVIFGCHVMQDAVPILLYSFN